jgi:hypothetical protein
MTTGSSLGGGGVACGDSGVSDCRDKVCVKVTHIMQWVCSRVHAIGQQAGDAFKTEGERLWVRQVSGPPLGSQSGHRATPITGEFAQSQTHLATQSPATFLGFFPG